MNERYRTIAAENGDFAGWDDAYTHSRKGVDTYVPGTAAEHLKNMADVDIAACLGVPEADVVGCTDYFLGRAGEFMRAYIQAYKNFLAFEAQEAQNG